MMLKAVDLDKLSLQLSQLLDSLNAFETILDKEAETLKSSDITPLTDIVDQKRTASESIAVQYDSLIESLSDTPISLKEFMLLDDFANLPKSAQKQFEELTQQIINCNEKNTANGLSVQALNTLNETLIQIFKGQDLQNKTYTASGSASTPPTPTNPLGKA
ncbi:flagella synthesis protein FlgN [Hydrogenovibrio marinus]|uniref:Flagellar biosynthesis protein FlgN n=1 Tax=Hydrogenovibrio marinus TaxID=28885 RepID=A0A066ZPJ1_HYDMR|nr:flagellar protein FlgN [Hydrogenovibrio marinus]KDN95447.1 hypothetical protein EI16_03865 [Hydrogenovibrio marinus]BBN59937.1 hypothetical protein HVMH_1531 [Hydrogenovibrio marinus]